MVKRLVTHLGSFIVIGVAIVLFAVAGGLYCARQQGAPSPVESPGTAAPLDLGITYLPITPRLAAMYGLDVDSGALVTQVIPGSPADKVGVKVGDIIISFNSVRIGQEAPLLGMMQVCTQGDRIQLEMQSGDTVRTVEFVHEGN